MKQYLAIIMCMVFSQIAIAQENYIEGYIINLDKDTLNGFIDYRDWRKNPNKVSFKETADGKPAVYTPLSIAGFGIQDDKYVSAVIRVEKSPRQISRLDVNSELDIIIDTTFLQTILESTKPLYFHRHTDGYENFYIKNDGKIELLVYKKYLSQKDGSLLAGENNQYVGQLAMYLQDCSSLASTLERVTYQLSSLKKLFSSYYQCISMAPFYDYKHKKGSVDKGFFIGTSVAFISFGGMDRGFRGTTFDYLADAKYDKKPFPSAGLFLNFNLAKNQGKWSIYNELMFSGYNTVGKYNYKNNIRDYGTYEIKLELMYLKVNNLIRFKYPLGKQKMFINGGISNGLALLHSDNMHIDRHHYGVDRTEVKPSAPASRSYEQSWLFGVGIVHKRMSFELRYENGNGTSAYPTLASRANRLFFLASYKL